MTPVAVLIVCCARIGSVPSSGSTTARGLARRGLDAPIARLVRRRVGALCIGRVGRRTGRRPGAAPRERELADELVGLAMTSMGRRFPAGKGSAPKSMSWPWRSGRGAVGISRRARFSGRNRSPVRAGS